MNFQQLEYVIAVHEQKQFSRAAAACHITQATLSSMVKKLEEELGVVLFDRSRKPVVTTEEGLIFIEKAKGILALQSDLYNLKPSAQGKLNGVLKLGIIPTVANSLLPLVLPSIIEQHPDLELIISEVTTEEIKEQLKADKLDAGILATPVNDETLEENILYYEAMMVYGVKGKEKKFLSSSDIKNEKIWLLEEGNCFRNQSITLCNIQEKSNQPNNISFKGSSFDTLINLADRFGGYTLIPELYYNLMAQEKQQKTRHFQKPLPVREISMIFHRPYAKRRTIDILSKLILDEITSLLITDKYKAKDLSIIGIG
ncbi:MAG: LysR substrate-binding domain-containing protein [Flavobacteriales bacterium]